MIIALDTRSYKQFLLFRHRPYASLCLPYLALKVDETELGVWRRLGRKLLGAFGGGGALLGARALWGDGAKLLCSTRLILFAGLELWRDTHCNPVLIVVKQLFVLYIRYYFEHSHCDLF